MNEKMTAYKIFRPILGTIYKLWYNPKVIGSENIPKTGRVLVVGNHVHIMDQCNIIVSTKRNLHYMAKKEYFDDKKVAWFFKISGCIPVDRSIKDTSATEKALEVLEKDHALGLFPEGTRNALKEEKIKELYEKYMSEKIDYDSFYKKVKGQKTSFINYMEELVNSGFISQEEFIDNIYDVDSYLRLMIRDHKLTEDEYFSHYLLPLKFGAVSMAHKTDSYIVPYAITGDYKFRSKNLVIRIGEPFKVEDDDLEKYNMKLDSEIKKLVIENYKNSGK